MSLFQISLSFDVSSFGYKCERVYDTVNDLNNDWDLVETKRPEVNRVHGRVQKGLQR